MDQRVETTLFSATTPVSMGAVGLCVRDLERMAAFYRDVIGLAEIGREADAVRLGVEGRVLVELLHRPGFTPEDPGSAGLFHTAFLLPDRAALGAWLLKTAERGYPLDGAADHLVSEALYLTDPEGNGIEVYRDRPRTEWTMESGLVRMASDPLDFDGVAHAGRAALPPGPWRAPEGSLVGHVHLRVGDIEAAKGFYGGRVGLDVIAAYPGATFLSSGGYHHHIGANIWRSRGAGQRPQGRLGLAYVEFLARDPAAVPAVGAGEARATGEGWTLADPWGTELRITRK